MGDLKQVLERAVADSDYARGALDVLALLALVTLNDAEAVPTDDVAVMVIGSLRAHLADGLALGIAWGDLDAEPPRGVDILRALERARVARASNPTPARIVEAAQAIFRREEAGEAAYLMQYDAHAGRYQPLGGKRDPRDPDLEAALRREIAEELGLGAPPDRRDLVLNPVGGGWVETALSATYGILTRYTFGFFHVARVRFDLALDGDTRWLARAEIAAERAGDGRAISTIYQQALGWEALDALPPTVFPS